MSLKDLFATAVKELRNRQLPFAVAGGLAADLYRAEPRLTMDIDFAIATDPGKDAVKTGSDILASLGLRPGVLRKADLAGGPHFAIRRKSSEPVMLVGRRENQPDAPGVDLLLPVIPWTSLAIKRASQNLVDYGFGAVPVLRIEDVILSKLYALQSSDLRAKDLDDLQSIYIAAIEPDNAYLSGQIQRLKIKITPGTKRLIPRALKTLLIAD